MALAWTIPLIARLVGNAVKNRKDKGAKKREEDVIKKERVPVAGPSGLIGYIVRIDFLKGVRKNAAGIASLVMGVASLLGLSEFSSTLPSMSVVESIQSITIGTGLLGIRDR